MGSIKKVIYLSYQHLTEKFHRDFYIQNCIDENLEVEYWDMTKLFYPKVDLGNSLFSEIVIEINSYKELKLALLRVNKEKTLFIIHINYRFNVIRLFVLLTKFKCKLAFFGRGAFPILPKKMSAKLLEVVSKFDLIRLQMGIGSRLAKALKYLKIVKTYDVVFNAGSEGYNVLGAGYLNDYKNAKLIEINYYDYDLYLTTAVEPPIIEGEYCVFLDEYLPYHPDFQIINEKTINPSEYYPPINKYFDYIEDKFNLKVVIAAHPKAEKYKYENPFNERKIVFNQTCLLTRDSNFVMTSASTSFSFALFYKKPIIFILGNAQIDKMYLYTEFSIYLSKLLNCKQVNFENFEDDIISYNVDLERYNDYKYKYITSIKSEQVNSSSIFLSSILSL